MPSSLPSRPAPNLPRRAALTATVSAALLLGACGGGGGASEEATVSGPVVASGQTTVAAHAVADTFPVGLVVASPAELGDEPAAVAAAPASADGLRLAADWLRAAALTLRDGDRDRAARLATALLPVGQAQAGRGQRRAELTDMADRIESVLGGRPTSPLGDLLRFDRLFHAGGHARCHGPSLRYADHEDDPAAGSGVLPGGDLGLWLETEPGSLQPCVVAQLGERTAGVRHRTRQGLLLMASMRAAIDRSSGVLAMPAPGATTDLTTLASGVFGAVRPMSAIRVEAASVALDAAGRTYTYRLALSDRRGGGADRLGEIVLQHTPGADATAYEGVMRISGFDLTADVALGCGDRMADGLHQHARVTTVRYRRAGDQVDFGARGADYCGAPASLADADWAGQVAGFTAAGELDPAARLDAPAPGAAAVAGARTGWRGNFERFAGSYDRPTGAGQFLHAWQAGTADAHARALAAVATYNTVTDERTVRGHYAFAEEIAEPGGALQGMICNWAGPGGRQVPVALFQTQVASVRGLASRYDVVSSRIAYAPTNACRSTTTRFDVNADGVLDATEGQGLAHQLDAPSARGVSVADELAARGLVRPVFY